MKRTNIYLAEEQTASLDTLAQQQGVSRAELIRQLLNRALTSSDDNLASDFIAIDNSFGALRDVEEPVRRPGGRE
ncbi:MAG: CopG family transcriptional regulator, partial [Mycobacterium sp.]